MITALNNVRSNPVSNAAAAAPAASRTFNAVDVIGSAMLSRMKDGFERPATASTAPAAAPKKKKKKKGGFFKKLGGFFKKAVGVVSKIANVVPGLSSIAKPLQMVSGFLGG